MDDIVSYVIGKKKGGVTPTGEIDITQNGVTNVSGYATANVQVPEKQLEDKSIIISTNTTTLIEPTQGKDGMSSVSVTTNVPQPSGKITITQNGTDIDVSSYASADVNVPADMSEYFLNSITPPAQDAMGIIMVKKLPDPIFIDASNRSNNLNNFFRYNSFTELPKMTITNCSGFTSFLANSQELIEVDLTSWSIPSYIGGTNFLSNSPKLKKVNMSNFNSTWSPADFSYMFLNCPLLEEVDLSSLDCNIKASSMFNGCVSMKKIDLSSLQFSKSDRMRSYGTMFGADATTGVPDNCLILVRDQASKDWVEEKFPRLTNVQIKSEYIANQGA